LIRTVNAGIHPEAEMARYLTDVGYRNTPQLFGDVTRICNDGTLFTLATLHSFVRNQGDGWSWTQDYLARSIEETAVTGRGEDPAEAAAADVFESYLAFAGQVGTRLAELHAALASETSNPDFAPQPATATDLDVWATRVSAGLAAALDIIAGQRDWPDDRATAAAKRLIGARDALLGLPTRLVRGLGSALRTRVHGDFHLGQVLVSQGDAFIIDFEGEPQRPLEERRAKDSPMRDVAGLLRSIDYAAIAAMSGPSAASPLTVERRLALLSRFRRKASRTFLEAYRAAHARSPRQWVQPEAELRLLDLFLLEKAAYEVRYEAANRPAWLAVPLRGLLRMFDSQQVAKPERVHA
jgi:maltose alpha-D-glucosyltransferase/alpha-amylase